MLHELSIGANVVWIRAPQVPSAVLLQLRGEYRSQASHAALCFRRWTQSAPLLRDLVSRCAVFTTFARAPATREQAPVEADEVPENEYVA